VWHSHVTAQQWANLTKPGYKTTYRIIVNDNALGAGRFTQLMR
jgi:branched-chain amino acid transport system substrate-binding protein